MAFFSEVKAKLGLDITPFERGLKNAQTATGGLAKGLGKQFAGTEKMAGALAAAIGLNMQGIANSIARFITGFSKDAEESLDNLVAKTEDAARKQEAALESARKKRQDAIDDEAAKFAQGVNAQIAAKDALAQAEREAILEQLDDEGKLAYLRGEMADLQSMLTAAEADSVRESELKIAILERESAIRDITNKQQEESAKWLDEIIDATEKDLVDAEKKRLDLLEKQDKKLKDQRDTVRQTLADYASGQRKSLLPTSSEVKSGSRNIGSGARRQLSALEKSEARARALSDAEQRKMEEYNDPTKSEGDRRRIQEEGRKIRADKEAELGRAEKLKGGLSSRVSDIETNKESLEQLKQIDKGIKDLNDKLAPKTI